MNISEFKTEIKKATCSIANDYFNTEVKSTDAVIDLVNGYTIDIDINTHWIEDVDISIDYDVPSIDNSRNELELTEVNMYDMDGDNIEVTPDMLELLIDWVAEYFNCETY